MTPPMARQCWFPCSDTQGDVFAQIERAAAEGSCFHVGAVDLMPHDGRFCAVFDDSCFDVAAGLRRCTKDGSRFLHLLANRQASASKVSIKTWVTIECTPATLLEVNGGIDKQGVHQRALTPFVLFPCYPKALPSEWREKVLISKSRPPQRTPAAIDVRVAAKRENSKTLAQLISLPVVVAADDEREGGHEKLMNIDLANIVLSQSVSLLIRDGWDFLKSKARELGTLDADLIQLNIGKASIVESIAGQESTNTSVATSGLTLPYETANLLDGLNRHVENLSIRRRSLLAVVDRGSTALDKGNTQAEIDLLERDIEEGRERIWQALVGSGQVSVSPSLKKEKVGQ